MYQVTVSRVELLLLPPRYPQTDLGARDWLCHMIVVYRFSLLPLSFLFTVPSPTLLVFFSESPLSLWLHHPTLDFPHFIQNMKYKSHNDVYFISLGIIASRHVEQEDLCELFTE